MRTLYIAGWTFVTLAGVSLYQSAIRPGAAPQVQVHPPTPVAPVATTSWFDGMRAHCNPVEIEVAVANNPPPTDWESQAYAAACYALAGKIERAAERLDAMPSDQREWAANVVFNVVHPVADAGDDDAAGPMMELVLRYTPENYMALYHAGIAQANLGKDERARVNLQRFLEIYQANDGWTQSARSTLATLGATELGR